MDDRLRVPWIKKRNQVNWIRTEQTYKRDLNSKFLKLVYSNILHIQKLLNVWSEASRIK